MAHPRTSAGVAPWGRRALGIGLAVSIQVPLAVLASQFVDALHFAYPFVVLPLLLAVPIAVQRQTARAALAAAVPAGLISGVVAAVSLRPGRWITRFALWVLVPAAAA